MSKGQHTKSARLPRGLSAGTTAEERKVYLQTVEKLAHYLRKVAASLDELDEEGLHPRTVASSQALAVQAMVKLEGWLPLLATLREFRLAPKDRNLLEGTAAVIHSKTPSAVPRIGSIAALREYRDKTASTIDGYAEAFEIAKRLFEGGDDVCEKNECHVGGCFRVVNTGGFDAATMRLAAGLMAEGARLVSAAGFPEVCYGDAYVTRQVARKDILAFYVRREDRMYVRAKPKKGEEALAVETIVHELGHRLHGKFGKGIGPRLRSVYEEWERRCARSPLDTTGCPFPSPYATTSPSELFAELFRAVVVGNASPEQREAFQQIWSIR